MPGKMIQLDMRRWMLFLLLSMLSLQSAAVVAGDSPQAVFKAAQAAGARKDYGTLVKLVAPSERPLLAFGTAMGVGMFVEFYEGEKADELRKKYQKIQKKYHIIEANNEAEDEKLHITEETSQEVIDAHLRKRAQRLYGHVNAVEYVPDLMAIVINMPEMAEHSGFPQEELSNLQIDGDRATGNAGEKPISFVREGGRWYLTADVMD
jgi:hypothetical protein